MPDPTEQLGYAIAYPDKGRPQAEDSLLRAAFLRRATHAVEELAKSTDLRALASALQSSSDFGAVARALGSGAIPHAALDLDPLADAIARGVSGREALVRKAGGLLSVTDAGRALGGISRQAVDKRRRSHKLLAVKISSDWRYPAFQFVEGGVMPGLSPVLAGCLALQLTGWTTLDFLLSKDASLGRLSPVQALQDGLGEDVARLLRMMETDVFG